MSIVYTSLTYALAGCVTFEYYFEAMCVIGFIRTSFGGPLSSAIMTRIFNNVKQANTANLGSYIDPMYYNCESFQTLYSEFQRQMLMVSLKEVYGWAVIMAVIILLAILLSDYRVHLGARASQMLRLSQIWSKCATSLTKVSKA